MASIEGIRIINYRVLQDVTLGRLWDTPDTEALDSYDRRNRKKTGLARVPCSTPSAFLPTA